jgi:protein-S-isoprenylcysteine O-methyltransferase Ste14
MTYGIIAAVAVALGLSAAVGFFVLKRVLRWAVRLLLLVAALVLLSAGALLLWWYSADEGRGPNRANRNGAAARPANRAR